MRRRSDSNLSDRTRRDYRCTFGRYVETGSIAGLTLREANSVATLERFLQSVADKSGTGAAKSTRSILSSIIGLAVRYRVLPYNATRDVRPARSAVVKATLRDNPRAFTAEERERVLQAARDNDSARQERNDVADLVHYMAGTGVRIGEALERQWADVDLESGRVHVRGTKTKSADRNVMLPPWLLELLRARAQLMPIYGLVFSSPGIFDNHNVRNVHRIIRTILIEAGVPWATAHTFRRTVATMIDAAGLPLAVAAERLGHSDPSMTASVYLGRKGNGLSRVVSVL